MNKKKYYIKHPLIRFVFTLADFIGNFTNLIRSNHKSGNGTDFNPNKILLIQLDKIGDIVLSTPAVEALRSSFPKANIDFLSSCETDKLLINNPNLNKIVVFDSILFNFKRLRILHVFKNILLLKKLRAESYDILIDLRADIRSIFIMWLIGGKRRISQEIRSGGFLLTDIAPYKGINHETRRKLDIVEYISGKKWCKVPAKQVYYDAVDKEYVDSLLRSYNADAYAVIHATAGWRYREWPGEYFLKTSKWIKNNLNIKVFWVGSRNEWRNLEKFIHDEEGIHNLSGKLTLNQLAYLLKNTRLFIGNDSGVMHIADSFEIPVIALFGPNDPVRYGPTGKNAEVIYRKVKCSPCSQTACNLRPNCMERITVDEVISAIKKLMAA